MWSVFVNTLTVIGNVSSNFSKCVGESFRLVATKSRVQKQTPWKPMVATQLSNPHLTVVYDKSHAGY